MLGPFHVISDHFCTFCLFWLVWDFFALFEEKQVTKQTEQNISPCGRYRFIVDQYQYLAFCFVMYFGGMIYMTYRHIPNYGGIMWDCLPYTLVLPEGARTAQWFPGKRDLADESPYTAATGSKNIQSHQRSCQSLCWFFLLQNYIQHISWNIVSTCKH